MWEAKFGSDEWRNMLLADERAGGITTKEEGLNVFGASTGIGKGGTSGGGSEFAVGVLEFAEFRLSSTDNCDSAHGFLLFSTVCQRGRWLSTMSVAHCCAAVVAA
jgi:hypothetical protein